MTFKKKSFYIRITPQPAISSIYVILVSKQNSSRCAPKESIPFSVLKRWGKKLPTLTSVTHSIGPPSPNFPGFLSVEKGVDCYEERHREFFAYIPLNISLFERNFQTKNAKEKTFIFFFVSFGRK